MPWMNGFNALLMAFWFVGLYVIVLRELKLYTIWRDQWPAFVSCCCSLSTTVCQESDVGRHTQTFMHTLRHTRASVQVSR